MKPLSSRINRIGPSQTVAIDTRYKQLLAAGHDVLSLGAGEPDLPMPEAGIAWAQKALAEGKTRYSQVTGIPELRQAVADRWNTKRNIPCNAQQVVITSGAKHAVFNALLALIEDGDEVIVPAPGWTTYPELIRFLGGKPVEVVTSFESGFLMTPEQLSSAITPKTKLMVLNSPCNPTGAIYPADVLQALGNILVKQDIACLSDEIYEDITYGDFKHVSIASLSPEFAKRTATISGMSKSFAMTGMRIGFVTAPPEWLAGVMAIQSHGTHHPATISQWAALGCLQEGGNYLEQMRLHFEEAKSFTLHRLEQIKGLQVFSPQGAFYAFCNVQNFLGRQSPEGVVTSSLQLSEYLLNHHSLATVPGSAFGMEGWLRLSFANSTPYLDQALSRFQSGLLGLR